MANVRNAVESAFGPLDEGKRFSVFKALNGQIVDDPSHSLKYVHAFQKAQRLFYIQNDATKVNWYTVINLEEVIAISTLIDNAAMGCDHLKVKDSVHWRTIYDVKDYEFQHKLGAVFKPKAMPGVPCFECGLILPLHIIEIDHHKPQSGGLEQAIIKVLRNIGWGLTLAPGKGEFARATRQTTLAPIPTKAERVPSGIAATSTLQERYTLTEVGVIYLSILVAVFGQNGLWNYFMNSAFNLKPICSSCNKRKSDSLKNIA